MNIKIESNIKSKKSLRNLVQYIINPKPENAKDFHTEELKATAEKERVLYAFTNKREYGESDLNSVKSDFAKAESKMLKTFEKYAKQQKRKGKAVGETMFDHVELLASKEDFEKYGNERMKEIFMEVLHKTYPDLDSREYVSVLHGDTENKHFHFIMPRVYGHGKNLKYDKCWQRMNVLREEIEKAEVKYGLTLTGGNKPEEPEIEPKNDLEYALQNVKYGRKTAQELHNYKKKKVEKSLKSNNEEDIATAKNDLQEFEKEIIAKGQEQQKSPYYTIENTMAKIKTDGKTIFELNEELEANNIRMKINFHSNGKINGITYQLLDDNKMPIPMKNGKGVYSIAAGKVIKRGKAKKRFMVKDNLENLDGWNDFVEAQFRIIQNDKYKYNSDGFKIGSDNPFTNHKPLTMYNHRYKENASIFFDFTVDKKPLCEQNKETGQISMLGDLTKENSKKSMELCKNWKTLSITSSSSQWLGYELNSWLTLDSEPKKSIKDFRISNESQCQNISFKDFAEATKGMQFSKEEMKHIKENLLSSADAIKHGNELDAMLENDLSLEELQNTVNEMIENNIELDNKFANNWLRSAKYDKEDFDKALKILRSAKNEEVAKNKPIEIEPEVDKEPENKPEEQQSNGVKPAPKTPEEMLAELNSKLNDLRGARTADIELSEENLHIMNDYADGKKTLTDLYNSASNKDRLSLQALKRKSLKAKNGELNVSKYKIS
ncbi:TPA: hypothetical protein KD088_003645 [Vibrio parahaemolyticus]|nr:hypothetical protein [Vibrio parahaemolyticus]